jgi:hypothetical protein
MKSIDRKITLGFTQGNSFVNPNRMKKIASIFGGLLMAICAYGASDCNNPMTGGD